MLPVHIKIQIKEEAVWQVWLEEGAGISFFGEKAPEIEKTINLFFEKYPGQPLPPLTWKRCSPFMEKVLKRLLEVPYGSTQSYKQIAEALGSPNAARAVGQACAKNPFPLFIPCHRILTCQGKIGGFAFGVDMKQKLLEKEK